MLSKPPLGPRRALKTDLEIVFGGRDSTKSIDIIVKAYEKRMRTLSFSGVGR